MTDEAGAWGPEGDADTEQLAMPAQSQDAPIEERPVHVARAELVLAQPDHLPLRRVPLQPDPLKHFADAFGELREDLDDRASVVIDLMPVTFAWRRHRVRQAIARERRRSGGGGGGAKGVWDGLRDEAMGGRRTRQRPASQYPTGPLELTDRRAEERAVAGKLVGSEPAFFVQVLIRASSEIKGRPQEHVRALIDCFDVFAGENYFKVRGRRVGFWYLGADMWWRRGDFDRRFDTGLFAPKDRRLVTAPELAGLLKPPSVHCRTDNVVRSGGLIPAAPRALPDFRHQVGVLPLGIVRTKDGHKAKGVYLADTIFSYFSGKAGYGKTETAINQFIHLARSGEGCFFLDPHEDALNRIKPYLTDVADRVVEINLAGGGGERRQAGWNLFSMEGLSAEHMEAKVTAVVNSFASALGWDERNDRALSLVTAASQSLVELALVLPPDIAPTIFQISTLLCNDEWRRAVIPYLSRNWQDYWLHRFPKLASEAFTVVTNFIDRLRSSSPVAGLLGSSRSSYNVRRAMDEGKIVLTCPAGVGDKDRLVANFMVYDLLQAALSRKDTPAHRRRPFYVFFDEVQTYDGATKGNLAATLEQARKYGLRANLLNQNPKRLTRATRDAAFTNSSILSSTQVDADAAAMLAKEWGGLPDRDTILRLEKYTFLTRVTLGGEVSRPFLVRGFHVDELWAPHYRPDDVAQMEETIDSSLRRRPVAETIAQLDALDEAILAYLSSGGEDEPLPADGSGGPYRPGSVRMHDRRGAA